jgi:hypothetical protein
MYVCTEVTDRVLEQIDVSIHIAQYLCMYTHICVLWQTGVRLHMYACIRMCMYVLSDV